MLSRAATRAVRVQPTSTPLPRPSTSIWMRNYAQGGDHRWRPSQPINFASSKDQLNQKTNLGKTTKPTYSKEQPEYDAGADPARNNKPQSDGAGPGITEQVNGEVKQKEYLPEQDEFSGPRSPDVNTAPTTEQPSPNKPLPDLRQGLPSTFGAEFGGQGKNRQEPHDPENITEDPREPAPGTGAGGGREGGELPKSAYETSVDRRRNRVANWSYLAALVFGVAGTVYLGRNWETEEEEKAFADAPSGWGFKLMYDRAMARINSQMGYYTEPTFPKLLPEVDPAPPYTLVVSLEDMLVHSEWTREHGWRTAKRPGVDYFLRYLSQYYELVIFTSLPSQTADPVIRKLDPFRVVMWPLFREATRYEKGEYIKDLSYLNRDLSKTILIDTNSSHAKLQPENSIILSPWKGAPGDKGLVGLIPFLEYIATMGITDVRKAIQSFEGKDIPTEFARREARAREEFNRQLAEEKKRKPKVSAGSWVMGALGLSQANQGLVVGEESVSKGLDQGKMLSDQMRERGMKQYEAMEKEIRENGEKWLKEMAEEEKKLQEEQIKSMKSGFTGWFGTGKKE